MPGPIDFLNQSLIPKQYVQKAQAALDTPSLERSPWEARLRGFGAGALEGLAEQITPLNIAGLAMAGMPGANPRVLGALKYGLEGVGLGRASKAASGAIQGASRAIPQLERYAPVAETLGETLPEFTAVGGEALYNAGRQAGPNIVKLAAEGTRNVKISPFQQLRDSGAFRGDRTIRNVGNLQQEIPGGLSDALKALQGQYQLR